MRHFSLVLLLAVASTPSCGGGSNASTDQGSAPTDIAAVPADLGHASDLGVLRDLPIPFDLSSPAADLGQPTADGAASDLGALSDLGLPAGDAGPRRTVTTLSIGSFSQPTGIAVEPGGKFLFVADAANHTVQKIDAATGLVLSTLGVPGQAGFSNGAGGAAAFRGPTGVAVDGAGVVYVADAGNHAVRKIVEQMGSLVVSTLAGGQKGAADGTGGAAQFNQPNGVAVDAMGIVYVADHLNCALRSLSPGGASKTLIGGCLANNTVYYLRSVIRDPNGVFYSSDPSNNRIKRTTFVNNVPSVTTIAGPAMGFQGGYKDGPAAQALFNMMYHVAFDPQGHVLVSDMNNHRIRRVVLGKAPTVETIAGAGFGSADGDALTRAQFKAPRGVAADSNGVIYVADGDNKSIRKIQ